jgi:hypothetical protein
MKKYISIISLIFLLFSGCFNGFKSSKCVTRENNKEIKKVVLNTVDSVLSSNNDVCNTYKIVQYNCEVDSLLEVKVKTKCDEKYFIFDEKINLLRVITVLKEIN